MRATGKCDIMPGSPLNERPPRIVLCEVAVIEKVVKGISKDRVISNEAINGEETNNFIIVEENVKKELPSLRGPSRIICRLDIYLCCGPIIHQPGY